MKSILKDGKKTLLEKGKRKRKKTLVCRFRERQSIGEGRSQIRETALRMLGGPSLRDRNDLTRAASEKEPEVSFT